MNDHLIGAQRGMPLHAPTSQPDAAENSPETNDMQQHAAAQLEVQEDAVPRIENYTISVQQVREHLKAKGLSKSKDTVQRWCRTGELDCQKLGVLGRYFTTETSLVKLEQKILPDMIAENAGAQRGTQVHEDAGDAEMQPHAGAELPVHGEMPLHAPDDTAARSSMPQDVQIDAGAHSSTLGQEAEVAELRAKVAGLTSQLEQAQEINQFLREEIVSSRGQRGDVVKIAEQMLGTLETIAIGGRLDKPAPQPAEPDLVRYTQVARDQSAV